MNDVSDTCVGWHPFPFQVKQLSSIFTTLSLELNCPGWWGIPLAVGGALLLVFSLIHRATLTGMLTIGPLSEVPPLVRDEAVATIMVLTGETLRPLPWQAIIVLALGLVVIVAGAVVKPGKKTKPLA